MALPESCVRSWPRKRTSPPVGLITWRIHLPKVVLPQPLSPTRPRVSPRMIWRDTPSTALTSPTLDWKMTPLVTGKYICRSRTSMRT